jgi:mitochondrial fission protein ELM1
MSATATQAVAHWPPVCWVVSDGKAGTENQSLGLAEAMGLSPVVKRLQIPRLWRELSLHLGWGRRFALSRSGIAPPWPDLLIGTGRHSVVAALAIKELSGGRTFTVQIQRPIVGLKSFDRVVVPAHDEIAADNVVPMLGALHRVTPALLRSEAETWEPRFAHLPRPRVAVLLGGANAAVSPLRMLQSYRLGAREIDELGRQLAAIARNGKAGLLVTASRRTGAANMARLRDALRDCASVIWDGAGDNPYYGMLGTADSILVTCDSINMICEACATGKPVQMIGLPGYSRKRAHFHRSLLDAGRIRLFDGTLVHWHNEPLREKERVAALVRQAYDARNG